MAATLSTKGRASIVQRLLGDITQAIPGYIAWGTGAGTTSPSDAALFNEVRNDQRLAGQVSSQKTSTTGDTFQVDGIMLARQPETITNVGIFDVVTSPYQNTLAAEVTTSSQVAIVVTSSGAGSIPAVPFDIQILSEVMTVTAVNGVNWTVTRGQNGSTALTSIPITTPLSSVSGKMYAKADFAGLPLNTGDSIYFRISIQFA